MCSRGSHTSIPSFRAREERLVSLAQEPDVRARCDGVNLQDGVDCAPHHLLARPRGHWIPTRKKKHEAQKPISKWEADPGEKDSNVAFGDDPRWKDITQVKRTNQPAYCGGDTVGARSWRVGATRGREVRPGALKTENKFNGLLVEEMPLCGDRNWRRTSHLRLGRGSTWEQVTPHHRYRRTTGTSTSRKTLAGGEAEIVRDPRISQFGQETGCGS